MSDQARELLEGIAAGSEAALEEFYQAYQPRITAYLRSRLNDPAIASDILNEVMLEVWKHAGRYEGRSKPLTWVLGIAHHKVVDHYRRQRRNMEELTHDFPEQDAVTASDALEGAQESDRVQECMGKLPETQRQVVHLAFFEDLSYQEISEIADCPEGTVKTRMFHAKKSLKQCLARLSA